MPLLLIFYIAVVLLLGALIGFSLWLKHKHRPKDVPRENSAGK